MKKLFFTKPILFTLISTFLISPGSKLIGEAFAQSRADEKEISYVTYEEDNGPDYDIFYDDSFFDHDATVYSERLASLSVFMSKYCQNRYNAPTSSEEAAEEWYDKQPDRVEKFFELIGFGDFIANEDYHSRTSFYTMGIGCASKQIGDYTVVATTVRSGGYALEWGNNLYLGDGSRSDMMHEGWYRAAVRVTDFIKDYIAQYNITGNVKLWLSGFSRGGAVINLASAFIDREIYNKNYKIFEGASIDVRKNNVFAYTFETPQGANIYSKEIKHPRDEVFNNIFNILNPNDLVTKVAMSSWGFTRFGVDKFITTEFFDAENFTSNRNIMKAIHTAQCNEGFDGDSLQPYTSSGIFSMLDSVSFEYFRAEMLISIIQGATGNIPYWINEDDERKANYDGNALMTIVLEETCKAIGSRDKYVEWYQPILVELILEKMTDQPAMDERTLGETIWSLLLEVVALIPMYSIPALIVKLAVLDSSITWINLVPFLNVLYEVYNEIPSELLTLAFNVSSIMDNHSTNVCVAHVCSQDQLYIDHFNTKLSRNDLKVVPFLDNCAYQRLKFKDFNELNVYQYLSDLPYVPDKKQIAHVDGCKVLSGEVEWCNKGIIVGLYCYNVSSFIEVFLPANKKFYIGTKSFSMKPVHEVYMTGYVYNKNSVNKTGDAYYKEEIPSGEQIGSEYFWFDSDWFYRTISKK